MTKSRKTQSFLSGLRFSLVSTLKESRVKVFLLSILMFIAAGVGVAVAIKNNSSCSLYSLREINIENFYSGFAASSSAFLARCFSLILNIILISIFSFLPYFFPLAAALFCFRAYLLGLNIALVFIFYGIGSIMSVIVVVLPCQILSLVLFLIFYLVLSKANQNRKKFGYCDLNRMFFIVLFTILLLLVNLLETILLFVLRGSVFLVI